MFLAFGDSLHASITEVSSGSWTISISDSSTSENYTTTVSYTSSHTSAEWIEEDPSFAKRSPRVPFDNFTMATFSNAATSIGATNYTIETSSSQPITMTDSTNQPVATPSILGRPTAKGFRCQTGLILNYRSTLGSRTQD